MSAAAATGRSVDAPALAEVSRWVVDREPAFAIFRDVHGVMEAQRQPEVLEAHRRAGLVACDGMPMVWASRWAGVRNAERVYGPDFMLAMCARAEVEGWKSFFYGGNEGVAERLSIRLREQLHFNSNANATTSTFRTSNSPPTSRQASTGRDVSPLDPTTRQFAAKQPIRIRSARQVVAPPRYGPGMATCPGALIVHADSTVMACTDDQEPGGCRGRDLRHDGDPIGCWTWTMSGCNYLRHLSEGEGPLSGSAPPRSSVFGEECLGCAVATVGP